MARTDPQLNTRIPAELKARLEASAQESKRSLNAEVIALLEEALNSKVKKPASDMNHQLDLFRRFLEVQVTEVVDKIKSEKPG